MTKNDGIFLHTLGEHVIDNVKVSQQLKVGPDVLKVTAGQRGTDPIISMKGIPNQVNDLFLVELNDGTDMFSINASGIFDFQGNVMTNLGDPITDQDAATKIYVSNQVGASRAPVRAGSIIAGVLATDFENGDTIDNVLLATGDRILIKAQASGIENGIYTVNATGAPSRASDMLVGNTVAGIFLVVQEGTVSGDNIFICNNDSGTDVVGTDALVFTSGTTVPTAGLGLVTSSGGTVYDVNVDGTSVEIVADTVQLTVSQPSLTSVGQAAVNLTFPGDISVTDATSATNATTGALKVTGGVSTQENLFVGGNTTITGNLTVSGTTTTVESVTTLFEDNIVVFNSGPIVTKDAGFLINRFQLPNDASLGDVIADTATETSAGHGGNAQIGNTTTITLNAGASGVDNFYNNWWIHLTGGTGSGQVRRIKTYVGATFVATIYATADGSPDGLDFSTSADATTTYSLFDRPFVGGIYDESTDALSFVASVSDPGATIVTIQDYIDIRAGLGTFDDGLVSNDLDTDTGTTLLLGKATATKIEIADTSVETEVQGPLDVLEYSAFGGGSVPSSVYTASFVRDFSSFANSSQVKIGPSTVTATGASNEFLNCWISNGTHELGATVMASAHSHTMIIQGHTIDDATGPSNGGTITNVASLYILNAPTDSIAGTTTITNGPYAIFVDAGNSRFDGQIICNDIDSVTATTLLLGKATATKIEIADTGVITEVQGPLNAIEAVTMSTTLAVDDIDANTATTLLLGKATATRVEIADVGIVTDIEGDLSVAGTTTLTSPLSVSSGGTGLATVATNSILTGNGTSALTAEANMTFSGSDLALTGSITQTLTGGVYQWTTDFGGRITLKNTTSSAPSFFRLRANDGDGTDSVYFQIIASATGTDAESLDICYLSSGSYCINVSAAGTSGVTYPLVIQMDSINVQTFNIDNSVSIGNVSIATDTETFNIDRDFTVDATDNAYNFHVGNSILTTDSGAGTHALISNARFSTPTITNGGTTTTTTSSTVYIQGAPTGTGIGASNYALYVDDGAVQIDSTLTTGGAVSFGTTLVVDDLDANTATTLLLGKAVATKVEIADVGIVTEVQGDLTVTGDFVNNDDVAVVWGGDFTTVVTTTVRVRKLGPIVFLELEEVTGTSNTVTFAPDTFTVAVGSRPQTATVYFPAQVTDNSVEQAGLISISTAGVITVYPSSDITTAGGWTATGTKTLRKICVQYTVA